MTRLRPPGYAGRGPAEIIVLPVVRIERGLWAQEFCHDEPLARPAPGSRPQLLVNNVSQPGRRQRLVNRSDADGNAGDHNDRGGDQPQALRTAKRSPVDIVTDTPAQDTLAFPVRNASDTYPAGDRTALDETLATIGAILRDGPL